MLSYVLQKNNKIEHNIKFQGEKQENEKKKRNLPKGILRDLRVIYNIIHLFLEKIISNSTEIQMFSVTYKIPYQNEIYIKIRKLRSMIKQKPKNS